MRRLMCLIGRHRWEHHINREASGPGGGYDLCARCGREKNSYESGTGSFKGPVALG